VALGKGLGEILEEVGQAYEQEMSGEASAVSQRSAASVEELEVEKISTNPYQPRKHFDEASLVELSESIKKHGLLQPIVVMEKDDGYLLIAGERRLRAHKLAKIGRIKAIVADVEIDSIRMRELALVENIQREDLNAIELANSYAELIEVHRITHAELSSIVHKSRSQITNTMRLLTLSPYAQKMLLEGRISQGHAKILVGLDSERQKVLTDTIAGQKLSVREAEQLVKQHKQGKKGTPKKSAKESDWMKAYAQKLDESLPFAHKIKANKLEITFENETELQNFIDIIKKS
jgi:ParB family chromosome partitioning protein